MRIKRLTAILLCLCMALTLLPATAWAADGETIHVGGVTLSVLIFLFPPMYGEGYDTISELLNGKFDRIMDTSLFYGLNDTYWGILIFLSLILLFKVFASSATNAGGGCGGIFAPSLYVGDGGRHVGRDARAADWRFPDCGTDGRICVVPPVDDCFHQFLHHD